MVNKPPPTVTNIHPIDRDSIKEEIEKSYDTKKFSHEIKEEIRSYLENQKKLEELSVLLFNNSKFIELLEEKFNVNYEQKKEKYLVVLWSVVFREYWFRYVEFII